MLTPADDIAPDGVLHAESAREEPGRACLCGMTFGDKEALDAHLLGVFMTAAGPGRDGARHAPVREPETGA